MNDSWIALVAVLCNVGAQLSMKHVGRDQHALNSLTGWLSPWLLAAALLYVLSFFLTVRVFATNPLSVASPAMAGITFLLIALASWLLLGEELGVHKLVGISLIFAGIVALTRY